MGSELLLFLKNEKQSYLLRAAQAKVALLPIGQIPG
jgi:hypothetical protein